MARKVFCILGILLAVAGFVAFTAIAIGVWVAKQEADAELAKVTKKVDSAADQADKAIAVIQDIITRAEVDLNTAKGLPAQASQTSKENPIVRMAMRTATRDLPQKVDEAREAIGLASDAVVVANAALSVLSETPADFERFGVDSAQVSGIRGKLRTASDNIKNAGQILGPATDAQERTASADQLKSVEIALGQSRDLTNEMSQAVAQVRGRADDIRGKAALWGWWSAVGICSFTVLGAIGQVALGRSLWRRC